MLRKISGKVSRKMETLTSNITLGSKLTPSKDSSSEMRHNDNFKTKNHIHYKSSNKPGGKTNPVK